MTRALALGLAVALAAPAGVLLDVPFVRQTRDACGAANAAMLLRYWDGRGASIAGADAPLERLHDRLYSAERKGTLGSALAALLEEAGLRTFVFEGRRDDLAEHVGAGRPLVVCLRPGGRGRLHYALVVGYDSAEDVVLLNDPARRKAMKVSRSEFDRDWEQAGRWTLLAAPAEVP